MSLHEKFNCRFDKLNDFNKQYIEGILKSLEFAQNISSNKDKSMSKSKQKSE